MKPVSRLGLRSPNGRIQAVIRSAPTGQWTFSVSFDRKPLIVPVPLGLLIVGARITRHVRTLPTVQPEEIRRLTEDKAFSIGPMRAQLGVEPISLQEGLAITFGSGVV